MRPRLNFSPIAIAFTLLLAAGCAKTSTDQQAADLVARAQTARTEGKLDEAHKLLDEAIAIYPAAFAHLERARVLAAQEKIDEAIADCEKGLTLDPGHPELEQLLAECKKPKGQRFQGGAGMQPQSNK